MEVFYREEFVVAAHSFDTTRKAKWIADSLQARAIPGLTLKAPALLDEAQLFEAHDPAYVAAVRTGSPAELATSQGFAWDAGLWTGVRASNGGAVAAALAALRTRAVAGSLSSGLHHARSASGAGFCTFNGLALAAKAALAAGAKKILVLDLDAHCGGGTHSIVGGDERIRHVDVSVDRYDRYSPADGNSLDLVTDSGEYLPLIQRRLDEATESFDLCLYNAGMDPFEGCDRGGLAGVTARMLEDRERLVFEWSARRGQPIAFVLAGGYTGQRLTQEALVDLHRGTLSAATAQRA